MTDTPILTPDTPVTLADFVARARDIMSETEREILDSAIPAAEKALRGLVPVLAKEFEGTVMRDHLSPVLAWVVFAEATLRVHISAAVATGWTLDEVIDHLTALWSAVEPAPASTDVH